MANYQNGKIYKIVNSINKKSYIGATTQPLCKRMNEHRCRYKQGLKKYTSYLLFDEDATSCKIYLLENFKCNNKEELEAREIYWIEKTECLNKKRFITRKQWYESNKEINNQKKRKYNQKYKEKQKKYREENKEKMNQYFKERYQRNKQKIQKIQNRKFNCECGGKYTFANKLKHSNTNKHKKYVQEINIS